jgi:hypothetical protein
MPELRHWVSERLIDEHLAQRVGQVLLGAAGSRAHCST